MAAPARFCCFYASCSDSASVLAADDQGGSPGAAVWAEIGPIGDGAGGGGVAALARRLAGVLDVDKETAAVGRDGYTCNFAAGGSGEEAADLA